MSRPEGIPPCPAGMPEDLHELSIVQDGILEGPNYPPRLVCATRELILNLSPEYSWRGIWRVPGPIWPTAGEGSPPPDRIDLVEFRERRPFPLEPISAPGGPGSVIFLDPGFYLLPMKEGEREAILAELEEARRDLPRKAFAAEMLRRFEEAERLVHGLGGPDR